MAAISQKIIGLVGGVSQQPDSLMLPGQFRECDNYYPDPTFGLLKRPGAKHVRKLDSPYADGSWFFICKGLDEKLLLQISKTGGVKLWDAQSGIAQTVNALSSSATTYATHDSKTELEVLQINDFIFVLNRNILVANGTATSPTQTPFGWAELTTIAYDTEYKITIDGVPFVYQSPTSSGSRLNTNTIVDALVTSINGNANYNAIGVANYIYIERTNGADFSLKASGSVSGTGLEAYKGTIDGVEDLPAQFVHGKIVRIAASGDSTGDDYFLKFETETGSGEGAGVWQETVGPGTNLGVDASTMPHAIIREADGSYTFRELSESAANSYVLSTSVNGIPLTASVTSNGNARWHIGQSFPVYGGTGKNLRLQVTSINANRQITGIKIVRAGQDYTAADVVSNNEGDTFTINTVGTQTISGSTWANQYWEGRTVGDAETAKDPTFVGNSITGMSFFKNRLVLMSSENVVCSQAAEFLKFYPQTVITTIDSDPIDLSAGSVTRIEFRHALQRTNGLLMFADNSQYVLQTRTEAFSPTTAELNLMSSFSHSVNVKPVDLGNTVVVVEENNTSIAVNELTISEGANPLRKELSKLIPSYIPTGIDQTSNSVSASLFAFRSVQEKEELYLFRYYTQDTERLIASWFKWTFPGEVELVDFHEDEVFGVLKTDSGSVLIHIGLMTESPGGAIFFDNQYVDLRMDLFDYNPAKTYVSASDETRIFFKDGCDIAAAQPCLVTIDPNDNSFTQFPTMQFDAAGAPGQQYYVAVEGDQSAVQYALGYRITSEARLPGFYVKKDKQADEINVPTIHRVRLYSHESGPYEISLDVPGRSTFTLTLPQIQANSSTANTPPMIRSAENIIPVMAKGRDVDLKIICNSPFPLALVTLIWEGTYNNKGIRAV